MTTLPLTAFEQAVIVAIFAVLLLAMAGAFYKILANLMKDFQSFISARDEQWQLYFEKREDEFAGRNNMVVKAVDGLAETIRRLSEEFHQHANETNVAITKMEERTRGTDAAKETPTQRAAKTRKAQE